MYIGVCKTCDQPKNFIDTSRVNFINIYTVKEYETTSELRITKCEITLDQTFFPDYTHHLFKRNSEMQPTSPCCCQLL